MASREKRNITALAIILTIILAAITVRTVWMIMDHGSSTKEYENPVVAQRVVRGTIYDRYGHVLAIETPYYSLAFHLNEIRDLEETAQKVAEVTDLSADEILEISGRHTSYARIKLRLTGDERRALESLRIRGLVIEKRYGRQYPQVHHASSLLGFANRENTGVEGLELSYEEQLNPLPGLDEVITYGNDLYLSLDISLQYILDDAVLRMAEDHGILSASALLLSSDTGAILASSSYPWFDPNAYSTSTTEQRREQISSQIREPGSVFKIFTLAALMDASLVTDDDHFICDGVHEHVTGNGNTFDIRCVEPHGDVTPQTMISRSCNGAIASWSSRMEREDLVGYLDAFGFLSAHDISLPVASSGYLAEIDAWSQRTKPTLSFGQEIAVSPVQLVTAATVLAENGYRVEPYLVEAIVSPEGEPLYRAQKNVSNEQIIGEQALQSVLSGMELAVTEGTATGAGVPGIRVGAKTGTAQVADPEGGGYLKGTFLASTLAVFPLDDPSYIIYVAAMVPGSETIWGSAVAAPAISQVIEDMVRGGYIRSDVMKESEYQDYGVSGD